MKKKETFIKFCNPARALYLLTQWEILAVEKSYDAFEALDTLIR